MKFEKRLILKKTPVPPLARTGLQGSRLSKNGSKNGRKRENGSKNRSKNGIKRLALPLLARVCKDQGWVESLPGRETDTNHLTIFRLGGIPSFKLLE